MRNAYYILLTLFLFGCNYHKKPNKESVEINKTIDSIEIQEKIEIVKKTDVSFLIEKLEKFYDHPDYFLSLYYRNEYDEIITKKLSTENTKIVIQNDEETRYQVDEELAKKYLMVENMDSLLVFNNSQELEDTIIRNDFEYYEAMISTSMVATYSSENDYKDFVVTSLNVFANFEHKKNPMFVKDSVYIEKLATKHGINKNYIFGSGLSYINNDTVAFISYSDYTKNNTGIYFLKNCAKTDSIIEDFIFWDLKPVPLSKNSERLYLASVNVPETDIFWTLLISINFESYKIKIYERNRYK